MMIEAERVLVTGPCCSKCKGGGQCACNGSPHTIHACRNPHCYCHTAAAHGLVRTVRRNGSIVYVPVSDAE